jgi:hypothetical protein
MLPVSSEVVIRWRHWALSDLASWDAKWCQGLRLGDRYDLQDRRETSIHLDEEPAIGICEPGPAFQLTPQDDQLMSENRIVRLKPALRAEEGQHGKSARSSRQLSRFCNR